VPKPVSGAYGALLYLLPAEIRRRDREELLAAFAACRERERARLGVLGALYAWVRATADVIAAAIAMRRDARRMQRISALRELSKSRGDAMLSLIWQDARHALRRMRAAPIVTATVILTLALATGATTAIFSVLDAVLLRALPYPDSDRLVMVYQAIPKAIAGPIGFSAPDFGAFEQRSSAFESVAAFRNREYELSGVDQPERIIVSRASASLFDTLRVPPALGRAFTREEDDGRQPVAVLSDSLWRRKFTADPGVIGRAIVLDRVAYTIVGVMPPGFTFPNRGAALNNVPAQVFLPIAFTDGERRAFGSMYNNSVVARLKPGVTPEQADIQSREVVRAASADIYPAGLRDLAQALSASVTPLRDETVGRVRTLLYVAFAAVIVVLLVACADLANLMLTRAIARQREMAVRSALGAGRGPLIRLALVESAMLAILGSLAGLLVARWVLAMLVRLAPDTLPRLHEVGIDLRVLAFTALLSIATAVLCGVLPAFEASRFDSADTLKESGRSGSVGRRQRLIFTALVTAQFALAVILLIAGGLLARSFSKLMSVDAGFRADGVLTLATSLPATAYPRGADVRSFYTQLIGNLEQLPGVSAAGASTDLPLGIRERRAFTFENESEPSRPAGRTVAHDWVLGSYFDSLGIPLKRGRYLGPQDTATSEPVVVINETMARTYWRDADPVGERMAWGGPSSHGPWMRIVGVVADVKQGPLNSQTVPQTFQPWLQVEDGLLGENVVGVFRSMELSVRTAADPASLASAVQSQIRALDPSLPVTSVRTLAQVVKQSASPQRFNALLIAAFALLALLLASLGIGGVLATSISRRTQELGVRMALGAKRADVLRMILREGMTLVAIGLASGLPIAFALTRLMSTLLFEVSPSDPVTFATVSIVLVLVALTACYIPARRATTISPLAALRGE
jgi:putative ABC transport system permease protein